MSVGAFCRRSGRGAGGAFCRRSGRMSVGAFCRRSGRGAGRRVLPEIGPGVRFFEKPAGCGEFRKVDFGDGRSISSKTLGPVKNQENEIG